MLRDAIFLGSGSFVCAPMPSLVTTILGSCVAVCLWDKREHIGGMNHYVLPRSTQQQRSPRFGDVAIDLLLDGMMRLGCHPGTLCAKIFGGAEVLPFGTDTVGHKNVRIALELLGYHRIPILDRCTGGHAGIMIRLCTETGDVVLHRLVTSHFARPNQTAAGNVLCG